MDIWDGITDENKKNINLLLLKTPIKIKKRYVKRKRKCRTKEYIKNWQRSYYQKNKESIKKKAKIYYEKNK